METENTPTIYWTQITEQLIPKTSKNLRELMLLELNRTSQSRMQSSIDSLQRSQLYLEWLYSVHTQSIVEADKDRMLKALLIKESTCQEKADRLCKVEMEICDAEDNHKLFDAGHVSQLFEKFMEAFLDQVTVVKLVVRQEIDLGNQFFLLAQQFIRSRFQQMYDNDPKTLLDIAKTLKVMHDGLLEVEQMQQINSQIIFSSINRFNQALELRQEAMKKIIQIVGYANQIVDGIREQVKSKRDNLPVNDDDTDTNRIALDSSAKPITAVASDKG